MKNFLLTLLAAICLSPVALAENYFKTGTTWTQYILKGSVGPEYKIKYYTLLDEITVDNQQVLPFVTYTEETKENPELYLYVRTEGERVYWRFTEQELTTWYMMYDFGLEAGESVDISSPHNKTGNVYTTKIKCLETNIKFDDRDGEWMKLEESESRGPDQPALESISTSWIIGIGSSYGPDWWNLLDWVGYNSWLINVTDRDGNVVYNAPAPTHSYVSEINASETEVRSEGNLLLIKGLVPGECVKVYSLSGSQISSGVAESSSYSVLLPSNGIYIIKIGDKSVKVII